MLTITLPKFKCSMSQAFEKTVLEASAGIHQPNKLATAVVDVVGKWCAPDGSSNEFDKRYTVTIELGGFHLEFIASSFNLRLFLRSD